MSDNDNYNKNLVIEKIQSINFENVYFGYKGKIILKGVSFSINKVGIYSFVGANGSGKTTIFSLIEKLYFSDSGKIHLNGINIEDIETKKLRSNTVYLSKEPFLINATILDNIMIGNENIAFEEIQAACMKVGIHNEIMLLKNGYNSKIDETGKNFSSGQKQKLAFVRAYIRRASLILLDEVTSDIDGKSEYTICKMIEELAENAIVINVSHREMSIQMSENVFFIQGGEIVDIGKHNELLNKNDEYSDFFRELC